LPEEAAGDRSGVTEAEEFEAIHEGGILMRVSRSVLILSAGAALVALGLSVAPVRSQDSGEKIYKAKCAGCHGPDGAGNTPAGKATKARDICGEEAKKASDAEWTETVVKGKNKMPAYDKKLSEAEIKGVIAYMRSLCKK
jgi:mono/diheme cytochrome c family protein